VSITLQDLDFLLTITPANPLRVAADHKPATAGYTSRLAENLFTAIACGEQRVVFAKGFSISATGTAKQKTSIKGER
jgi:hypothetical protein